MYPYNNNIIYLLGSPDLFTVLPRNKTYMCFHGITVDSILSSAVNTARCSDQKFLWNRRFIFRKLKPLGYSSLSPNMSIIHKVHQADKRALWPIACGKELDLVHGHGFYAFWELLLSTST